jgi:hypothetical protein
MVPVRVRFEAQGTPVSDEKSLFAFEFHMTPWEACLQVNFDNVRLAPDFIAACTRDHLSLMTTLTEPRAFGFALNRARELAQRLMDAHALFCASNDRLLEAEPTTWLEVKGLQRAEAVWGYMHRSLASGVLDPNHPDNGPLREAGALVNEWGRDPALMLALGDFRSARREPGPYYAFHAFRVLENIRDAFPGEERAERWDAMNVALGTTKETWAELTDASTRSRHLQPRDMVWLGDPERHDRLLSQARDVLRAFIAHLPSVRGNAVPSEASQADG